MTRGTQLVLLAAIAMTSSVLASEQCRDNPGLAAKRGSRTGLGDGQSRHGGRAVERLLLVLTDEGRRL
jgi:hypothetical protein